MIVVHEELDDTTWLEKISDLKTALGYTVSKLVIHNGDSTSYIKGILSEANPDYVLLIGDANEEPEENKELVNSADGNFIPFHYELMDDIFNGPNTPIANDDYYIESCTNASIGRIPAETRQEVTNWVDKLVTHSKVQEYSPWRNKMLFITGNRDHPSNGCRGKYREMERDTLIINYVEPNGYIADTLNSKSIGGSDYWPLTLDRAEAFEASVNDGRAIIHAHGTGADWSFLVNFYWTGRTPGNPEPAWNFTNSSMYPFLFGFSCSIGMVQKAVDHQEFDTVMEKLLFLPDTGIIGAVALTWITGTWGNRVFSDIFYDEIFNNLYFDMGAVLKATKIRFESEEPCCGWISRATHLFGDPSMALPLFQRVSGILSSDTTWQGAIVVEDDIVIPSEITLTILPGSGVFLYPGKKIYDYGTLLTDGTIEYPVTFVEIDSSMLGFSPISEGGTIPSELVLKANYPNPFNLYTFIDFGLPKPIRISLAVYDVLGHEVTRLVDDLLEPGYYSFAWNGRDQSGREHPSGIYIARLVTPEYTKSIKMILLK